MTRGYLGSTPDGGIDDADREPAPPTSNLESLAPLFARLRADGGRYLLSVGLTREESAAQEAPTYGGKATRRWLTDGEYAALCSLGSRDETSREPETCTEKDAARYEWLRENWKGLVCHTSCSPAGRQVDLIEVVETLGQDLDPQSLDHAIDAAMKTDDERSATKTSAESSGKIPREPQ